MPKPVWMFVYNNCAADARVLKEAGTLKRAGHEVRIVAVLDRHTEPREERDGITIVRIDRNPPHYRLLRRTRWLRRWLRLHRTRAGRARLRARGSRRAIAALRRRAPAALRLRAPRIAARALETRPYRAIRWRVLRASPALRRRYYRRAGGVSMETRLAAYRAAAEAARRERRLEQRQVHAAVARAVERDAEKAQQPQPPMAEEREAERAAAAPAAVPAPVTVAAPPSPPGAWARADRRISHAAYRAVMTFHRPLLFLDYYWRAYRLVRAEPPGIVHAHDLNTLPVAAALSLRTNAPLVYDAHELYPEVSTLSPLERRVWRLVERLLIRRADRVVTVCESIAGELSSRYRIPPPAILLNCPPRTPPPAADGPNLLRARAGLAESDEPIVLYQGGFAPYRGLPELVRAAAELERGTVVLMGWGALEPQLAGLIAELDLGDRVRIVGPVAQHELLRHTSGADVGVIPYQPVGLNNYYTTPNKLFEYIAAGVPIAGSDVPEIRRFVGGLRLGATFDPAHPADIARVLNGLVGDAAALAEMRERALAVRDRFVWETQEATLLQVYDGGL